MINLTLNDTRANGAGTIRDITSLAKGWRRSIRSVGGYWDGSFEFTGNEDELSEMFENGIMREVVENYGGITTWEGFVAAMEFTTGGLTYTRSWADMANRVNILYTRITNNAFTNGSSESGAWASENGATVTQSSAWASDGTYSSLITTVTTGIEGAQIQSGISIVANQAYDVKCSVNIISGDWYLYVLMDTAPFTEIAIDKISNKTGPGVLQATIPASNTLTTTVKVLLLSDSGLAGAQCYGDGAYFGEAQRVAWTGWSEDTGSTSTFGDNELIMVEGALVASAATAMRDSVLARRAWPKINPPAAITTAREGETRLRVSVWGYVQSLRSRYYLTSSTATASAQISAITAASEYVTAGIIDTNSTSFQIDARAPLRGWEIMREIARMGDTSGNRWALGVYANRQIYYQQVTSDIEYYYSRGQVLSPNGGSVENWLVLPGLMQIQDFPTLTGTIATSAEADPRNVFIQEVEWSKDDDALTLRREGFDDV